MARQKNIYGVVDMNDKVVFTGTKEEVAERLGIAPRTVECNALNGTKAKGLYYIDKMN